MVESLNLVMRLSLGWWAIRDELHGGGGGGGVGIRDDPTARLDLIFFLLPGFLHMCRK